MKFRLSKLIVMLVAVILPSTNFAATSDPLVQFPNLEYVGAFRLPGGGGASSFDYADGSIAFNPANNSLFIVGHDQQQMVAEVKIPNPVNATSVGALPVASFIQQFADPSEGKKGGNKTGGLLVHQGKLYGTVYIAYDADHSQTHSHYISGLNLSQSGDAQGLYRVQSPKVGYVSGYMGDIPAAWQSLFGFPALTGNCCISIISRTSFGPAVLAFDPKALGNTDAPSKPLVYYTETNPLDAWNSTGTLFNGSTRMGGVVFPAGTRSVLFFGRQGTGPYCYGTGGQCNDPVYSYQGDHAYPYRAQVWAYDANELLKVSNGQLQPWQVKPYATWGLNFPTGNTATGEVGGAAYDPATGRIFVVQSGGESNLRPLVHVYKIATGSQAIALPAAPSNLSVQ